MRGHSRGPTGGCAETSSPHAALAGTRNANPERSTMFIRAFITMVAADAVDRHLREQQHSASVAAEPARAAAVGPHRAPVEPPRAPGSYDPMRPERPT